MLVALSVFLVQMALIGALYVERRRRSAAELTTRRIHTELAHASRLAVAGELTASIAHEINNPLNIISGYAELTMKRLESAVRRSNHRAQMFHSKSIQHALLGSDDDFIEARRVLARVERGR